MNWGLFGTVLGMVNPAPDSQVATPRPQVIVTESESARMVVKTTEGRCGSHWFQVVYAPSLVDSRNQILALTHNGQDVPKAEIAKMYGRTGNSFAIQQINFGKCLSAAGATVGVEVDIDLIRPGSTLISYMRFKLRGLEVFPER